jgi:hypothetical protein
MCYAVVTLNTLLAFQFAHIHSNSTLKAVKVHSTRRKSALDCCDISKEEEEEEEEDEEEQEEEKEEEEEEQEEEDEEKE